MTFIVTSVWDIMIKMILEKKFRCDKKFKNLKRKKKKERKKEIKKERMRRK